MTYGITGNTLKDSLWQPAADLVRWMAERDLTFCLHHAVAEGLAARGLADTALCVQASSGDLADSSDVVISFGGDGTLLHTAHEVGRRGTPILGVNIGRLGFLADIGTVRLREAVECLERGDYRVEPRLVLEARLNDQTLPERPWALNDFVIERTGEAKLLSISVQVDGSPLNVYWADGLIIATPTGSTAYSLSSGGPIMVPGCGSIILTPVAPHTLTVRPVVLPESAVIQAQVLNAQPSFVLAADGKSMLVDGTLNVTIRRAEHAVNLVRIAGQNFFETLRTKLMWGARSY